MSKTKRVTQHANHNAQLLRSPLQTDISVRALTILRHALFQEEGWPRVHAAEALLANGYHENIAQLFSPLADTAPPELRIGIWRVLAQDITGQTRSHYVRRIRQAFLDPNSPDRLHAAETRAKLDHQESLDDLIPLASHQPEATKAFVCAALTRSGHAEYEPLLASLLLSPNPETRMSTAYAMRFLPPVLPATLKQLRHAALAEPADSAARVYLFSSWYIHEPTSDRLNARTQLLNYPQNGNQAQKCEVRATLEHNHQPADTALLAPLLHGDDSEVRMAAADALLRIAKEKPSTDTCPPCKATTNTEKN